MTRLPPQPAERIDRSKPISFTFDGKPVAAFAGDTIVSALYASGRRIFGRSFKYHRPRGELDFAGQGANSLVQIGPRPGVRASAEPVTDGLAVQHTNAKPGLDFDVMRATDIVGGPFTPPGFYYKTFIRPRRLWPVYEKVLRHAAGLGVLPKRQAEREWRTEYRRRHCDVLIIGGGIAGLAAALQAATDGADVVLVDEGIEPGGALLEEGGHERARELAQKARDAGAEILSGAPALGYFDGLIPVWQGSTLHQVRAAAHVAATGTLEQPLVFLDNDLPGVMLSGGARRLAALYSVKPGENAVVAAVGDRGLKAALALHDIGVRVLAVADLRPGGESEVAARLEERGIELLRGQTIVRALGRQAVSGAVIAPIDGDGYALDGRERRYECDLVLVSGGEMPATSLLLQGGAKALYDKERGRFLAAGLADGVYAAGSVAGFDDVDSAQESGTAAGAAAAARAAGDRGAVPGPARPQPSTDRDKVAVAPAIARDRSRGGKAFVDLDEDITYKDIAHAAAEGYDSIELSKRYTTVTMGPTQGRFSQLASVRALGACTGIGLDEVGLTTARPPWASVPLGALAGRPFEPAKRSAIHGRQREQSATIRWAGDWRRAYDYGDPEGEALAVHESAGVIDVSTLSKLLVRGPQAGELLDMLYPNRFSNLAPGRVRYGVMVSDSGRIMDDGTIGRIDENTFYVTTTSGGAGAIEEWFRWWLAVWDFDATVTDLTQGLCAINVAGPKSREVLAGLCDLDLSTGNFGYMDAKQGTIAGVSALALRIGFVGEVGYEIHFPAAYGEHVWDQLVAAGARPFGLEPQRILRLQKMHVIVGQDTDSESTPYGASMPWIIKLDKEQDFIGRWALEHAADAPMPYSLVGFVADDGYLPNEGAVVLPEGQVTSARRSPQLGRVIGMAWVPDEQAVDGSTITIVDQAVEHPATVTTKPFFDPDGEVLKA